MLALSRRRRIRGRLATRSWWRYFKKRRSGRSRSPAPGLNQGLTHATIIEGINRCPLGRIPVTYFKWGGEQNIKTLVGGTLISDSKSARVFAKRLCLEAPISVRQTSISGALIFSLIQITTNKIEYPQSNKPIR